MSLNEYDELSLYDPSLRDAVLYELEMLHPPPPREPHSSPRTRARPALPETSPLVVESSLVAAPSSQKGTLSPVQRTSGSQFLWIALLVIVLLGVVASLGTKTDTAHPSAPTLSASHALIRIAQLDEAQYGTAREYTTWAFSTCSSAAMTEVINAYEALTSPHTTYRITDILKVESSAGQITPDLGLLYGLTSIQKTVAPFGYQAANVQPATLDDVIQTAQSGRPVIVGFRDPVLFPTGHILVVRGGNTQKVFLADSSRLNFKSMSRSQFTHYWTGFAVLVEPK